MIMPAARRRHWNAWASRKHCCNGWSWPSRASPWSVVTSRPSARKAGSKQLWTGLPSSQTVQAPQSPASQPFFTPNQPRSRRKVRRHWPGQGSAAKVWLLIRKFMDVSRVRCPSRGELGANLLGEVVRHVLAVRRPTVHSVTVQAERNGVLKGAFQFLRGGHGRETKLDRPDGCGGDREQEFTLRRAPRAHEQHFRAPEVGKCETAEGELLAEGVGGQEDRAQQF